MKTTIISYVKPYINLHGHQFHHLFPPSGLLKHLYVSEYNNSINSRFGPIGPQSSKTCINLNKYKNVRGRI